MIGLDGSLAVWAVVIAFAMSVTLAVTLFLKPKLAVLLYVLLMPIMQPLMDQTIAIPGSRATIGIGGLFQVIIFLVGTFVIARSNVRGKRIPVIAIFLVFLFIIAISIVSAPDTIRAIKELLRIASFTVMFLIAVTSFKSEKDIRNFVTVLFLSLVIPFVFGIYQEITQTGYMSLRTSYNLPAHRYNRIMGTFGNPVVYAMFINFPLLLCLSFGMDKQTPPVKRFLFFCTAIPLCATLFLTYTRSCWFGMIAAIMFMGIKRNRGLIFVVPVLLLLFFAFAPLTSIRLGEFSTGKLSFSGRIEGHTFMLPKVFEQPILGHGLTSFGDYTTQSDHLRLLLETGFLGYAGFLCLLAVLFKSVNKSYGLANAGVEKSFVLAYLAFFICVLVVGFSETNAVFQYYVWIPAGIAVSTSVYKEKKEAKAKDAMEAYR